MHAGVDCLVRDRFGWPCARGAARQWRAIAEVEAERDGAFALRADSGERLERRQRFESHHQRLRARVEDAASLVDVGDAGVNPERRERTDVADLGRRSLGGGGRSAVLDRVEIGEIDLRQAEHVDIHARERQWVSRDPDARTFANRRVQLTPAAAGMDGAPVLQIDDADDSHEQYSVAVILGWDIGGVNTKAVRLDADGTLIARSRPFELQREPAALGRVLTALATECGASAAAELTCAVTMTAELSQMFRAKRDGVAFVLDAVGAAFPNGNIRVFTTAGRFVTVDEARRVPLSVAAANWAATATLVAHRHRNALLVDIGTTTTDIIPIVNGSAVADGRTDPARLASGELVYTGALRTPVEAIVRDVPYREGRAAVSAEGFALIGDVHLWRGGLAAGDYSVSTPDGRAVTREFAGERLARVICADDELIDEAGISRIADAVADAQVDAVAVAIERVSRRHPSIRIAVVTGLGEFIAVDAAGRAGLEVVSLSNEIGADASRYAPAAAVALLLSRQYEDLLVIKVGGGLLAHPDHLDRVLAAIADAARTHRVLIVPGGGPFADAVRDVDKRLGIGDDTAHWMAILAMDQYAHLLASRVSRGQVVSGSDQMSGAHDTDRIPVLAPAKWLGAADPLPHTWDVTSDSIAAWVAGELRAAHLLLVKPPGATGTDLVDAHFERSLPSSMTCHCLAAEEAIAFLCHRATATALST